MALRFASLRKKKLNFRMIIYKSRCSANELLPTKSWEIIDEQCSAQSMKRYSQRLNRLLVARSENVMATL